MKKLKNLINKNILKQTFNCFPITVICVLILTIIVAFMDFESTNELLNNIIKFGLFLTVFSFFFESLVKKKNKKQYLFYLVGGLISFLLTYFSNIENQIFQNIIYRVIACYSICLLVLAFYFNYKKSKKKFNEYVTEVFIRVFQCSVIYLILTIGVSIVCSIFIFLVLDNSDYMLVSRLEILVFGFYYLPKVINSFVFEEKDNSKFILGIISYVLEPLVLIAFIIIYIYIFKILIFRDIPSNQIFRILAGLFILGLPIWTMVSSFKEKNILDKINNKLPYFFIPFLFLQIYSIGVRIINNGLTESRYLCIMLIIFEIIYIITYFVRKERIENVLFILISLTIISTIVPYLNMSKASILNQYHNLKIYTEKNTYTETEKRKILGAYYYLNQKEEGKKYIDKLLSTEDIEKIEKFIKDTNCSFCNEEETEYYYVSTKLSHIDISGYKKIYMLEQTDYTVQENIDFSHIEFDVKNSDETIILDIEDAMNQYIKNRNKLNNYIQGNYEIKIDSSRKFIVSNVGFRYYINEGKAKNYSISGYLLEK